MADTQPSSADCMYSQIRLLLFSLWVFLLYKSGSGKSRGQALLATKLEIRKDVSMKRAERVKEEREVQDRYYDSLPIAATVRKVCE